MGISDGDAGTLATRKLDILVVTAPALIDDHAPWLRARTALPRSTLVALDVDEAIGIDLIHISLHGGIAVLES
jgi:hypothetical protein